MNANTLALDIVRDSTQITRDELEAAMDGKVLTAIIGSTVSTLIRRGHLVERDDGVLEIGDEEAIEAAAREREQRKTPAPIEPVAKSHREDPSMRQYPPATREQFAEMKLPAKVLHLLGTRGAMLPLAVVEAIGPGTSQQTVYNTLAALKHQGKVRKAGRLYELANGLPPGPSLDIEPTAPIVDVQAVCADAEELSRPEPAKVPPAFVPVAPKPERVRTIADVVEKHTGHTASATVGGIVVSVTADSREQAARMLAAALGAV